MEENRFSGGSNMGEQKGFTFTFEDMTLEPITESDYNSVGGSEFGSARDLHASDSALPPMVGTTGTDSSYRSFTRDYVVGEPGPGGGGTGGGGGSTADRVMRSVPQSALYGSGTRGGPGGDLARSQSERQPPRSATVTAGDATPKMQPSYFAQRGGGGDRRMAPGPGDYYGENKDDDDGDDGFVGDVFVVHEGEDEDAKSASTAGDANYLPQDLRSQQRSVQQQQQRSVRQDERSQGQDPQMRTGTSSAAGQSQNPTYRQSQVRTSPERSVISTTSSQVRTRERTSQLQEQVMRSAQKSPPRIMHSQQRQGDGGPPPEATQGLVQDAEESMSEMRDLLGKLNTGTATRQEKERLESLNAELSRMKEDVERSVTRDDASRQRAEVESLRAEAHARATGLVRTVKIREAQSVIRAVCAAESVDLAFVVDCTKSMQPFIDGVKSSIKDIVRQIESTNGNLSLRLAVVGYRDVKDTTRFDVLDFVQNVNHFEDFVGRLRAFGGYDHPEDMAGGIRRTNALNWSHPTRVVFLIADSPCHGREFHPFRDDYPDGTPGIDIVRELRTLRNKHDPTGTMNLAFGRITAHTDQMIERLSTAYGIRLKSLPIEEATKISTAVTRTVRKSIFKTMTIAMAKPGTNDRRIRTFAPPADVDALMRTLATAGGPGNKKGGPRGGNMLKRFSIVPVVPSAQEWSRCPALKVQVYRNTAIRNMRDLRAPLGFGLCKNKKAASMSNIGSGGGGGLSSSASYSGPRSVGRTAPQASAPGATRTKTEATTHSTMFMRRAPNPFAQGEIRIAFYGQLAQQIDELPLPKNFMVMKSYKHIGEGVHDRLQYLKQMEVSNIAHFLAESYNASEARPEHCATVHFLPVCVVEEESATRERCGERRFCVEPPLPTGKFIKYSNNTGYWNEDVLDETLLRFTEWTARATDGYLLVTDLQGVQHGTKYHLTDPAILCRDIVRFGNTNLGEGFMRKCVDSTRSHLLERGWERGRRNRSSASGPSSTATTTGAKGAGGGASRMRTGSSVTSSGGPGRTGVSTGGPGRTGVSMGGGGGPGRTGTRGMTGTATSKAGSVRSSAGPGPLRSSARSVK